jgi:polyisoprenoid-binding protein YceI
MKKKLTGSLSLMTIAAVIAFAQLSFGGGASPLSPEAFASAFAARSAANAPPQAAAAGAYAIDPAHSSVGFSVRHLGINDVPGRFREFSGSIQYDPANVTNSSVTFAAKAASIDTAVERRDAHLRSADFFDVANHPEITFKSTRIEKKGSQEFVAHGDFTMRGVTKQIAIPFKLHGTITDQRGKMRLGVEAGLTINRQDYGVSWSQKLDSGGLVVANDVKVTLLLESVKQEPKAEPATTR